jgi:hypothetical protein
LFPIFELLENSNKYIFIEHEQLFIVKNELEDIFKLIEKYGSYNQSIDIKKSIYLYLTAGGELFNNNNELCFSPEKQFVDHIYYIILKQDLNYFDSLYCCTTYPSFCLLYRTNLTYGYIPNEHPIYTNSDYIWKPIHDINYITHQFNSDLCKYKEQYPITPITVLFVNHKIKKCGGYQYGLRLYNILQKSKCINYVWREIENYDEYMYQLSLYNYDVIFYNYHPCIMGWLNNSNIQKKIKNIGVQHNLDENKIFDITLRLDTTLIYSNDICVDKTNIRDIMNNSSYTFNKFKNLFSNSRLIKNVNSIIIDNLI